MTFYEGATVLGSDGFPPYTAKLDIPDCVGHTVTAIVEDSLGQTTETDAVAVAPDCTQPQPQAQAPARPRIVGTLPDVHQGGSIVRVDVAAPGGVASADFYLGTRKLCSVAAPPFACLVKPTGADVGSQALRVVVTDLAGQSGEASRTIVVNRFRARKLRLLSDRLRGGARTKAFRVSGRLDLPAVVDQPFGAGRAFLFASDAFFRAWHESVERQALNALLYPLGPDIPADPASAEPAPPAQARTEYREAAAPAGTPIAKQNLPAIKSRPVRSDSRADDDIRITVHSFDARALRRVIALAPLSSKVRKRISYVASRGKYTLIIRGGRVIWDDHQQNNIMSPIMRRLKTVYKVKPIFAQL